ncbi:MAG: hypothetical protein HRU09_05745 [Oligoflexales bacterium]|nr:hypothetical protein [Oligoflexales bacterium]
MGRTFIWSYLSIDSLDFGGNPGDLGFISKPFGDPGSILAYVKELLA